MDSFDSRQSRRLHIRFKVLSLLEFPLLALLASGGHTELVYVRRRKVIMGRWGKRVMMQWVRAYDKVGRVKAF